MNKQDSRRFIGEELQDSVYIWAIGYRAAFRGARPTDNPYIYSSEQDAWINGYQCAMEQVACSRPAWCSHRIPRPAFGVIV